MHLTKCINQSILSMYKLVKLKYPCLFNTKELKEGVMKQRLIYKGPVAIKFGATFTTSLPPWWDRSIFFITEALWFWPNTCSHSNYAIHTRKKKKPITEIAKLYLKTWKKKKVKQNKTCVKIANDCRFTETCKIPKGVWRNCTIILKSKKPPWICCVKFSSFVFKYWYHIRVF